MIPFYPFKNRSTFAPDLIQNRKMSMNRKKKFKKSHQELELEVIEQDLRDCQTIGGTAMTVMESLEDKVSAELFGMLKTVLLGFSEPMQLEIADDLLDFACHQVIHTTGCISVDVALGSCYKWIAEEKGIMINYDKLIM